jgi:signal transduction histidine kinase
VAALDPSRLAKNPIPPGVRIEEVLADHVSVGADAAGTLRVPAGRRSLEVRYTGLSFSAPERVRFRYRLEKFDRDWVDAGSRRTAYYTNLSPGRYRFRVAACNEDGIWNEAGASVNLRLLARFWQTPLFLALCVAAAALLVFWMHRVNVRDLSTRFAVVAERNRLAGEIHDSLAQGFTGVVLQLEAAEKKLREGETPPHLAERVSAHLLRARTLARESLEDARRSVWALRPKVLEGSDLVAAVRAAAEELSAGTARHVEVEVDGPIGRSSPDVEDELLRVVREALANSLLHSNARNIRVTFTFSFRRVTIVVKDDGKGFSEAEADGFGLTSMRTRLKRLGGRFTVTSAPGRGTTIEIVAPRPLLGRARRKK